MTAPVSMYLVRKPPEERWLLLRSLGFRLTQRHGNWYRFVDLRLPAMVDLSLRLEQLAAQHGLDLKVTPMRRHKSTPPRDRSPAGPSAAEWLREHDKPSKLDRLRAVRRRNRQARRARTSGAGQEQIGSTDCRG